MKYKKWAVFVSQTGSEVVELCKILNVAPGYIITNNPKKLCEDALQMIEDNGVVLVKLPFRPTEDDYDNVIFKKVSLITLHGYLRILPSSFIKGFKGKIYNGHPGLISEYPELKGKDPQVRAWESKHRMIGSVVHEVIPEVDEGKILLTCSTLNYYQSLNDVFKALKGTSILCWISFIRNNNLIPLEKETREDLQFAI